MAEDKGMVMILLEMSNLEVFFTKPCEEDDGGLIYDITFDDEKVKELGYTNDQVIEKINEMVAGLEDGSWDIETAEDNTYIINLLGGLEEDK
jgi:hypothetical protein